jgi:hypothetical protein
MDNRFKEYLISNVLENGAFGDNAFSDEAFELLKDLYNTHYGSIDEDENLISIHTGGWSDNEELIAEFRQTGWWLMHLEIEARGGHYFFETEGEKSWKVVKQ